MPTQPEPGFRSFRNPAGLRRELAELEARRLRAWELDLSARVMGMLEGRIAGLQRLLYDGPRTLEGDPCTSDYVGPDDPDPWRNA
jgi:hypothetical protein